MLVPTGLVIDNQPPALAVDVQKSTLLRIVQQAFFPHAIPSFLNPSFYGVNLISNLAKVHPVRKFQRSVKSRRNYSKIQPSDGATGHYF
jgi:hypothetical protein